MPQAEAHAAQDWLRPTLIAVLAVTLARVLVLWGSPTDLYVDESQYWVWGQYLDFGYFSKPPMIGWVLRVFDELAIQRSAFSVRLPAPLFHGVTAMLLAGFAHTMMPDRRGAALWVAMAYLSLPIVAVGSFLISTDTIMAPFLVGALMLYWRLCGGGTVRDALLGGALLGCAFLSKYAALYFLPGAVIAYALYPSMRPHGRHVALFSLTFLLVAAPNILWNVANDLTTVSHTMDNIGWVKEESPGVQLNFGGMAEFIASQFAVFGPVFMVFWLLALRAPAPARRRAMIWMSVPVWAIVIVQALMSRAYANWAFAAILPAVIVATLWALERNRIRGLWVGVGLNVAISAVIAVLVLFPMWIGDGKGQPLAKRYVNVAAITEAAEALAREQNIDTVVARSRGMLADFFFHGADSDLTFYAKPPDGAPHSYYQQKLALPDDFSGPVLYVSYRDALTCRDGSQPEQVADLRQEIGSWSGVALPAYVVEADCLRP
ncbi:glycosyltransferase family 39 protein [Shimia sp. NS0008-38b]|uniref:ArnT family glycosyltransferase n=1 Tax=Shimia sp. NS0008-38b TaxID=3127653 RepID=UPI003106E9C6